MNITFTIEEGDRLIAALCAHGDFEKNADNETQSKFAKRIVREWLEHVVATHEYNEAKKTLTVKKIEIT
jgi:hypothetical protein